METKQFVWLGALVGSVVGSYIPALWGAGVFSLSSMLLGAVGAIVGVYFGFSLGR